MIDNIQLRTLNGNYIPSVKLSEAIKAFLDVEGEKYLLNPGLATDLADCKQLHCSTNTISTLKRLINDGVTEWILDAYDNDTTLVGEVENYAKEEGLDVNCVFKICNSIEEAINGPFKFQKTTENKVFSGKINNQILKDNTLTNESMQEETPPSITQTGKHIIYRGIELGCTYNLFSELLAQKVPGTHLSDTKEGKASIYTTFLDADVSLTAYYTPKNHYVYKVSLQSGSWPYKTEYKYFKKLFTSKYGEPKITKVDNAENAIFTTKVGKVILSKCFFEKLNIDYVDKITNSIFQKERKEAILNEL